MSFLAGALTLGLALAVLPSSPAAAAAPKTTVSVKASSSSVVRGAKATLKISVKTGSRAASGSVYVYDGSRKVKTLKLKAGKASYSIPKTAARGVHRFKVVHKSSKKSRSVNVTVKSRATWSVSASATTYTRETSTPTIAVVVKVDGTALNGTTYLREGARTLAAATTKSGKATLRVPATLTKGTHKLTVSFSTATKYVIPPPAKSITFTTRSLAVMAGDGTYVVGSQVQPGLYVSKGNTDFCYWERDSDFLGTIEANDIGTGTRYMRIKATDALVETSGCNDWYPAPSSGTPAASIAGDGWYRIGVDLVPGVYQTVSPVPSSDFCYWARRSDATGDDDIIANDIGAGMRTFQVEATDAFLEVSGCGAIRRIG